MYFSHYFRRIVCCIIIFFYLYKGNPIITRTCCAVYSPFVTVSESTAVLWQFCSVQEIRCFHIPKFHLCPPWFFPVSFLNRINEELAPSLESLLNTEGSCYRRQIINILCGVKTANFDLTLRIFLSSH